MFAWLILFRILKDDQCCGIYQNFISFNGQIILYFAATKHFVYSFICDGCSHHPTVVNNADVDSGVQIHVWVLFSVLLGIYLGLEFLDHIIILCLTLRTAKLFFATAEFYLLYATCNVWGSRFSTSSTLCNTYIPFWNNSHSCGVKWYLTVVLRYISLITNDENHFICLLVVCVSFLEMCLFQILCLVWNFCCCWGVGFLYILWILKSY